MKKIFILFLLTLFAIGIVHAESNDSGSGDSGNDDTPECMVDSDCSSGRVCLAGDCEDVVDDSVSDDTECVVDSDCSDGRLCVEGDCEDVVDDSEDNTTVTDDTEAIDDDSEEDAMDDSSDAVSETYDETDEELQEEVAQLDVAAEKGSQIVSQNAHGARVRILQLERHVQLRILQGDAIINFIEENYPGEDTSSLNSLLDELEQVITDIRALDPETDDKETLTAEYVNLLKSSIRIVHDFKVEARKLIPVEDRSAAADALKSVDTSVLKSLNDDISLQRREYNAQRLDNFYQKTGKEGRDVVDKVRKGELTPQAAVERATQEYNSLTPEQKEAALTRIRNEIKDREALKQKILEKAKMEYRERVASINSAGRVPVSIRQTVADRAEKLRMLNEQRDTTAAGGE